MAVAVDTQTTDVEGNGKMTCDLAHMKVDVEELRRLHEPLP